MNASEPVAQITQMFADHVSLPTIGGGSKLDLASSSYSNVRPSAISKGSSRTSSSGKDLKSYRFDQKAPEAKGPKVYSPSEALSKYGKCLTPYEQEEIKQFQQIFFVGQKARKINAGEGKGKNFGYDDDKGRYKCVKGDHMSYRYEVMKGLGKGSFGDVVKAHDHKTNTDVALKIIRNEKRFHKQAQYEIKILDLLKRQDKRNTHNVIHMKDFFLFRGHLCLSFEMMACDMYAALKRNDFKGFSLSTIRGYCTPLITALRVLRRSRIIHCDLKPENILMKHPDDTALKIIDFGSSCFDHEKVHSYIQSRFYRSPEVILGLGYGTPIDMWSFGCILAELYTGQPIFPGHDEKEQLLYQMEVLGVPPQALLKQAKRRDNFFTEAGEPKTVVDRKNRKRLPRTRPLSKAVPCKDEQFLDFLSQCLTWDPNERITPREAAHHPFVLGKFEGLSSHMSGQEIATTTTTVLARRKLSLQGTGTQQRTPLRKASNN